MHGMLSAAVILVVFAVIALAGAGSAVWLYRAAAASAWRAQPAPRQLPVESAVATGVTAPATADLVGVPDPGWPGPPAAPGSGRPASQETTPDDDEEFGVVWEAAVGVTADHPGPPAAPEEVYDLAEWPDLDSAGAGTDDSGPRGPRAWPDLARSLYSRGWPAMDSAPSTAPGWPSSGPLPHPEPDGHNSGGPGSGRPRSDGAGSDGPGSDGPGSDGPGSDGPGSDGPGSDGPGSDGPGSDGPGSDGPGSNSLNPNSPNPSDAERDGLDSDGPSSDGPGSDGPGSDGPGSDGPGSDGTEGPRDEGNGPPPGPWRGGAKVYVLGEPRRPRP